MQIYDIPKSGRCGDYVFYMRRRKLFRRRYVAPRNVRTAARRHTRRSFGAVARAWGGKLTEEQRRAWMASAVNVKSHPRLWQSGPLTGEMHFQGINNARARIGLEMLLWPPEHVMFGTNPVTGLAVSYAADRIRLRLRVSGPVTEDIMVFAQALCSAGRKKWRHGAYLVLLSASPDGEHDITDLYVERYGEPEPGEKIFIRTRQQKDGWEGRDCDLSEVVPVKPVAAAKPEVRQCRLAGSHEGLAYRRFAWQAGCSGLGGISHAFPASCAMHTGVVPEQCRTTSHAIPVRCFPGTRVEAGIRQAECIVRHGGLAACRRQSRWRELWRGS
jgi:hypothetical protein